MNEKTAILCAIAAAIISLLFISCAGRGYTDEVGARNLQIIGQLEQSIEEFDRRIERAASTSASITDEVSRLREQFTAYTEAVEQLRKQLSDLQREIGSKDAAIE